MANGHYQKIAITAELQGEEDPRKALYELKKIVQNFHFESNNVEKKERKVDEVKRDLKTDIQSCKELKVLESYSLIVKNNPEMQEIYNQQKEKLTK
jgi:hypothetical protein